MDQLNAAFQSAYKEEDVHEECTCDHSDVLSSEEINDVALDLLAQAAERVQDPVILKALIIHASSHMISWHSEVAEKVLPTEDFETVMAWARDAGKFQAINNILLSVSIGPNDVFYKETT
tara:strand:+ start:416 stop:775 length:360 start_codon:yes stop_codon:yes gene_type:complete